MCVKKHCWTVFDLRGKEQVVRKFSHFFVCNWTSDIYFWSALKKKKKKKKTLRVFACFNGCVHACACTHTHTHTHTCAYIHMHTGKGVHTYRRTHTHMHMLMCALAHIHASTHTQTYWHTHVQICAHMLTSTHTHARAHTQCSRVCKQMLLCPLVRPCAYLLFVIKLIQHVCMCV